MLTTKLEAINTMLSFIDEAPVDSLSSGLYEASIAQTLLDTTSKQVQSRGWFFNLENNYTLTPNIDNKVELPERCLSVDNVYLGKEGFVQRGRFLYNKKEHTYKIKNKIVVDIILLLEFEELPEVANNYITIKSGRILQDRILSDTSLHQVQQIDEALALNELYAEERSINNYNIFDNISSQELLNRSTTMKPSWL